MKKASPLSEYFKEVIYGGIDGIITTFAVVAGFAGSALSTDATTELSFTVVLLFGLANLFADSTSMGLGNFLSVRSEKDLYSSKRDKEADLIRTNSNDEFIETVDILLRKGFSETDAHTLATIYKSNEDYWIDFMMNHELAIADPRGSNPLHTGLATFLSFLFFGIIPLIPFIFFESAEAETVFYFSIAGTFVALVLLGLLKWKVVGAKLTASLCEVIIVGAVAATIAYFVGTFFA